MFTIKIFSVLFCQMKKYLVFQVYAASLSQYVHSTYKWNLHIMSVSKHRMHSPSKHPSLNQYIVITHKFKDNPKQWPSSPKSNYKNHQQTPNHPEQKSIPPTKHHFRRPTSNPNCETHSKSNPKNCH